MPTCAACARKLFLDGRDIARPDLLESLAAALGLDVLSVSTSVGTTASRSFGTTLKPAVDRSPEALTASSRWLRLCSSP